MNTTSIARPFDEKSSGSSPELESRTHSFEGYNSTSRESARNSKTMKALGSDSITFQRAVQEGVPDMCLPDDELFRKNRIYAIDHLIAGTRPDPIEFRMQVFERWLPEDWSEQAG